MINFNKFSKLVTASIKSRMFGTPMWVHFYLTRKCNLSCKYCFVREYDKKDLDAGGVLKVIDKLYSLGIRAIAFFGGEPTLRRDFCDILEYANKKGIFTFFTTNGTLLTEDYINRIGKTGVDFIELSVDSIFEFEHSKKSYTGSKKVLDLLLSAQKDYHFNLKTHLVLTKNNISSVIETVKTIREHDIPLTIGYIIRNTYNNIPDDERLFFNDEKSKQELFEVIDEIVKLKKDGYEIMDSVEYFEGVKDYVSGNTNWGCTAGKYSFSVDSDGSVQLCAGLKPYPINIMEIDSNFFKNKMGEIKKIKETCQKKCYSNCHNTAAYYIEHPLKALLH